MYENILMHCILLFSSLYTCMPDKLQLRAPKFALRGTNIKLSCIGRLPPNGNTAEFLVGDKTLTNVRIHDETCFSTVLRRVCLPTECACHENQKDYMTYYQTTEIPDTNLLFSCKMKFENIITVSKIAVVTVIELKNLSLLDSYSCNSSSSAVLVCRNSDTKSEFGFYDWVHSYDGVFIRTLPGTVDNGVSLLMFQTCSYQDYGEYTCRVWYDLGDEDKYEENKTTSLLVDAISTILDVSRSDNAYEATYFSRTRIIAVQWFENKNTIINSTVYPHKSQHVAVTLPMHGVMVKEQGYKTTLFVEERNRPVGIRVCVTNTVGTACKEMEHKPNEMKESLDNINTWIILGTAGGGALVVIVVAVSVVIGLSRRKPRTGKHQVTNRTQIEQQTPITENPVEMNTPQYHAIEEYERPVHPYDRPIRDVPLPRPPETAPVPGLQVTNTLHHTYIDVVDENDEYEIVD